MLERLDDSAEQLLGLARDEAAPLRHNAVSPLHLLLAVLREAEGSSLLSRSTVPSGLPAGLTHRVALTHVARRMPPQRDAHGGYLPASFALMSVLYEAARDSGSQAMSKDRVPTVRASHLRSALLRAPEVVALLEEIASVPSTTVAHEPEDPTKGPGNPSRRRATVGYPAGEEAVLPAEYQFGSEFEPDWDERPEE